MFGGAPADAAHGLKPWAQDSSPGLSLDQLDGGAFELATSTDSITIVHFFATWCEPCVEEMASLQALHIGAGNAVTILAVDVGEVDARVRRFFSEHPVGFAILLDRDRAAMKAWGVEGLPTSFVLAPGLRPALKADEPVDWAADGMLSRLLALSPEQTTITNREDKVP
ncbi:TlpA disulfide reductase family protein [Terrihabitans rhizophilus]|uniref:TlpA disulfide reductase family protein n=1 Tax=Terrihabitans rhizophilus TaxID=3092662 RepID=A0ABU4RTQ4_9HYPH|nr:TlpA disulfide reductase family protein [Terrihabitans sp. PJ23]MDX6807459.1 TlpA disulfide reductase family protein [Terrihabitans sp. PJ23]